MDSESQCFRHHIANQMDAVRKTFPRQVFYCGLAGAEQQTRQMVGHDAIDLFGHAAGKAPQTGLYVVDVNYFPGYRGVPDAARRLADYIAQAGA